MTNKKRMGLAVPINLYNKMVELAKYHGKTINALCLEIFWDYFEDKQKIKRS